MARNVPWAEIPSYVSAVTVLEPGGNIPAEVTREVNLLASGLRRRRSAAFLMGILSISLLFTSAVFDSPLPVHSFLFTSRDIVFTGRVDTKEPGRDQKETLKVLLNCQSLAGLSRVITRTMPAITGYLLGAWKAAACNFNSLPAKCQDCATFRDD
jgi:hypothetical protein